MAREHQSTWQSLGGGGDLYASEEDYEHGYKREVRQDLQQYLAFRVGDERYAVRISDVSEITVALTTTPVPRTAPFVQGVANIRGVIIPVVDLAMRLMLPSKQTHGPVRRLLIVRRQDELYGLVIDEVHAVIAVAPEALEEAPGALAGPRGDYIQALARYEGEILIVLDLSTVLDPRDFLRADARRRGRS